MRARGVAWVLFVLFVAGLAAAGSYEKPWNAYRGDERYDRHHDDRNRYYWHDDTGEVHVYRHHRVNVFHYYPSSQAHRFTAPRRACVYTGSRWDCRY